jgi:hypothetical protein
MKRTLALCIAACVILLTSSVVTSTVPHSPRLQKSNPKLKAKPAPVFKPTTFKPACASPSFPSPAPTSSPGIDSQCGITGDGVGPEGEQNSVKNNFCAKGTPQVKTIADLIDLQNKVLKNTAINFGSANQGNRKKGPTINRAPLKALGEGTLVTLKAFVLLARPEGGESVNCGKNVPDQPLFHDIHINLVGSTSVKNECSGVVAEMSPHHRPDAWTHENVAKVAKAQLPVRVTGQLYFDSSHFPCAGGKSAGEGNPSRVSLWEIHPIYMFEVCTADCGGDGKWLPLDQWAKEK